MQSPQISATWVGAGLAPPPGDPSERVPPLPVPLPPPPVPPLPVPLPPPVVQPSIGWNWHEPAVHVSVVQGLESLQSAFVVQAEQLATGWLSQAPAVQVSLVQRLPSLQSVAVVQGMQPELGSCEQIPPEQ